MGWEKKYPILKNYPDIVDKELIALFAGQVSSVMDELMKKYDLSMVDAILVAKDILYREYLRRK